MTGMIDHLVALTLTYRYFAGCRDPAAYLPVLYRMSGVPVVDEWAVGFVHRNCQLGHAYMRALGMCTAGVYDDDDGDAPAISYEVSVDGPVMVVRLPSGSYLDRTYYVWEDACQRLPS